MYPMFEIEGAVIVGDIQLHQVSGIVEAEVIAKADIVPLV
jgi:hypothetical protein